MGKNLGVCPCGSGQAAVARCGRCSKPVCPECQIEASGDAYCSRECADVALKYKTGDNRREDIPRSRPKSLFGMVFWALGIIVIAWLVWWLVFGDPGPSGIIERLGG